MRKGCRPQISYGISSISYQPAGTIEKERHINTKDWKAINNPKKVTLESLEELFRKYLQ